MNFFRERLLIFNSKSKNMEYSKLIAAMQKKFNIYKIKN